MTSDDSRSIFEEIPEAFSTKKFTRRQALGMTAAASAALSLPSFVSACGGKSGTASSPSASASVKPRRGGTLRVGVTGGSSADGLSPMITLSEVYGFYQRVMYEPLIQYRNDGSLYMFLAEEMTPNAAATEWTIRLKPGITFHNGKDLTADDLKYTFATIFDPKSNALGRNQLASLDVAGMKKLDKLTLRVPFKTPYASFPQVQPDQCFNIFPEGFDIKHPVGTGAFQIDSFAPGQQATFKRYADYWQTGLPYVDELVMTDYADPTAQINALLGGAEDIVANLTPNAITTLTGQGKQVIISNGGAFCPFCMRVDVPPFDDVRVRQAMRLIVDREEMRKLVYGGYGAIGNDITSPFDPAYDRQLPQREQDIAQAKSLLKAAGREGLTHEIVTADVFPGVIQAAQVFSQQAKAAGVTIPVRQTTVTDFYGPKYLTYPFSQDYYSFVYYLPQVAEAFLPNASWPEIHWNDPHYNALYAEANATVDDAKRTEICHEMQSIDYNEGGFIVAGFPPVTDGYSPQVHGLTRGSSGTPLNNFDIKVIWLG